MNNINFDFDELAQWCGGKWLSRPQSAITGFCFDSRKIKLGELFVALRSDNADGHDYVGKALASGAAAALVQKDSAIAASAKNIPLLLVDDTLAAFQQIARGWRRKVAPFIVGVTGSVGKSTVKEWTAAMLADWKPTASTSANFNNDIGLPASILAMPPNAEYGVFEAGMSHPGDMTPLCATMLPNAAIITCIAPVHIEFFESLAGIAHEKATLLRSVPSNGFAVLDAKGGFFDALAGEAQCRIVGVCTVAKDETPPETARYTARLLDETNCRLEVNGPGLETPCQVTLGRPGAHNALNAILATAAAHECGVPWETIIRRLSSLPGMALRWERFSRDGLDWVCDAYNASPTSMAASIRAFAMIAPPRTDAQRFFVLGDMFELGRDERRYHAEIAEVLASIESNSNDTLLCTGKLAPLFAPANFHGHVLHAGSALDAARILRREARPGAAILLKASHGMHLDSVHALYSMPIPELQEGTRNVIVLGAGRSGIAAKSLLESLGMSVTLLDGDVAFPNGNYALAVVSPGIPPEHAWLNECKRRGIRAIPELELGSLFWRGRILAVTGSKGKSSIVKFCADALTGAGLQATPCGNYGMPLSELALRPLPHCWAIVETSSFQLENIVSFRPDISILLNLQADHLDRHKTMAAYAKAKFKIFANFCEADDTAIIESAALDAACSLGCTAAARLAAMQSAKTPDGKITVFGKCPADGDIAPPPGTGYFANPLLRPAAQAAATALAAIGLKPAQSAAAFAAFTPLPHRMATVAESNGVIFIDNSKATSLAALAGSLLMAGRPCRLIAGGRIKEDNFSDVIPTLEKFAKKVYLIGEASKKLFNAWSEYVPCEECVEMRTAVLAAVRDAHGGEAVLLAPGCASFDQFGGYAERGDFFARCVAEAINPSIN